MSTLTQIKTKLGYDQFNLNTATKDGKPTDWLRHWDNDNRVAVSIHKDTVAQIQANPQMNELSLQEDTRTGAKGEYKALRIVAYKPAEVVL